MVQCAAFAVKCAPLSAPLIRLIMVLTMWRIRGYILGKHHRTRATVKVAPTLLWRPHHAGAVAIVGATFTVAPVQRGGAYCATVGALWGQCVFACFATRGVRLP